MLRAPLILVLAGNVLLAGCSSYLMGMDEKTWKALPPAKRAELLKQQAAQEHEKALARIAAQLRTLSSPKT